MRSSPAFPGCPSKGRPLLANAKHAGQYFRIRISFTLPQHGEVPERSNGEPLSLSRGGTEGSNPCTLQSGYWLVSIVDWPDRAGLPGVAHESLCFEHLERTCTPAGRPRRKSRGRVRFERQYRD